MHFIKRHPKKAAFWVLLVSLFLFTRFYNLFALPIFTDEAIYIYWAKFIATTHSSFFISLADGKPPLLIWVIAVLLSIFPHDWYLLAGRLPSIGAGLISLFAIYFIAKELFRATKAGYFAVILYIFSPFILLYDRMALFDSMLQSMVLCSVYFSIRTARTMTAKDAMLWGLFLGLALLSKPTAILFVLMTPIAFLFLTKADFKKDFNKIILSIITPVAISEVINNLQRVSNVYSRAALKNAQFQQPIDRLLKNPFELMSSNLHGMFDWTVAYFSYPFPIIIVVAFAFLLYKKTKIALILLAFWLVPLFALAIIGREIFPRYILFTTPYFILAIAYFFYKFFTGSLYQKIGVILLLIFILYQPLIADYYLLTDPSKATMAREDKQQYVTNNPSGYGVNEVIERVNSSLSQGKKVTIVTQGTFGLFPYAFTLKYWHDSRVTILPRWPLDQIDPEIYQKAQNSDLIILFKDNSELPKNLSLKLVDKLPKPGGLFPILVATLNEKK